MELKTERLLLRRFLESDAGSLYEYAKDPDIGPVTGWKPHTSLENSLEIIRNGLASDTNFAVCLKSDGIAIGSIGLNPPKTSFAGEKDLEIGFWIGKPFWGHGYIPEAVGELLRYAFEELGCEKMWYCYYLGNEKSRRCQEKCGFLYHHTEENVLIPLLGEYRTKIYSCLSKERWISLNRRWASLRPSLTKMIF